MRRTQINLTDGQHRLLTALSSKTGAPLSAHIRMAIDLYLKKRKPQ
jgi:predicted DNA-binding protein